MGPLHDGTHAEPLPMPDRAGRVRAAATPTPSAFAPVRWAEVEPGFFVASRDGEFAGFIESNTDGSFVAFDGHSSPIGRYTVLADAKASLLSTPHPANLRRRRRARRAGSVLATAAGGVAAALALTAGVLAPHL